MGKDGFKKPRAVYMTHDQHTKMTQLLATSHSPRHTIPSTTKTDTDGMGLKPVERFNDLVQNYRQTTFLSNSTQHRWLTRPDGTFIPPPTHSLDKTNTLSDVQHMLYSHLCGRGGAVIENALLSRLSQFSAPPGVIAEFDSLSNIIQFEYAGEGDELVGTLKQPLFGSSVVSFGSRTHPQSNQPLEWDWKRGGIILAGVSDPGNLGTIMRTAHAFGLTQMVVIDGCDIYNSKVVSASSGAIAHVNIITCTGTQFVDFFQEVVGEDERALMMGGGEDGKGPDNHNKNNNSNSNKLNQLTPAILHQTKLSTPYLVGLTPNRGINLDEIEPSLQHHFGSLLASSKGKPSSSSSSSINTPSQSISHQNKPWLVVGSEAFGLPSQIEDLLHLAATIPVQNDFVDSLNASVAASIAIYVTANRIGNNDGGSGTRGTGDDGKM